MIEGMRIVPAVENPVGFFFDVLLVHRSAAS